MNSIDARPSCAECGDECPEREITWMAKRFCSVGCVGAAIDGEGEVTPKCMMCGSIEYPKTNAGACFDRYACARRQRQLAEIYADDDELRLNDARFYDGPIQHEDGSVTYVNVPRSDKAVTEAWEPKVGDYVRSKHEPWSAGQVRSIESKDGRLWLKVITTSGWEGGQPEHFVQLVEARTAKAAPCVFCTPRKPCPDHDLDRTAEPVQGPQRPKMRADGCRVTHDASWRCANGTPGCVVSDHVANMKADLASLIAQRSETSEVETLRSRVRAATAIVVDAAEMVRDAFGSTDLHGREDALGNLAQALDDLCEEEMKLEKTMATREKTVAEGEKKP